MGWFLHSVFLYYLSTHSTTYCVFSSAQIPLDSFPWVLGACPEFESVVWIPDVWIPLLPGPLDHYSTLHCVFFLLNF